jgi:hypothetical protein
MNSSLKKTIQINPELFKIQTSSKSKTKSNRERKSKPEKPITPNFLKKQLIDRIKNYKKNTNNLTDDIKENISSDKEEDDEFILSMNFLSSISNDKEKPLTNKVTYKTDLISSPNLEISELKETKFSPSSQNVNVDLPIELVDIKQSEIEINEDIPILKEQSLERNITTNLVPDNLPYGCLKNGSKPTYRSWLTQKNNYSNKPVVKEKENIVEKENIPITEREKKLNELKHKFKNEEPTYIKKIIKKKYTLGKSKIHRKVGVLIKDMNTRKKIIDSHKNLKTHDIQDIKSFLRNRGLIKIGNYTPIDILRKIYETTILTGDVTNTNKDILLHNLLNDTTTTT